MPPITLTRAQSRKVDNLAMESYGICGLVLMENAGRGLTDCLCRLMGVRYEGINDAAAQSDGQVVICCGKGNNAGDGFVVARHLELRGVDARVLLWAEPEELTGDAATNFAILRKTNVPIEVFGTGHDADRLAKQLAAATWIVDALLGTGARGEPRPPFDAVIDQLNAAAAPILAVDLPSGLDCDTGEPAGHTITAAATCTFMAAKPGLLAKTAEQYVGDLHVLDIGAPRALIDEVLAQE